MTRDSLKTLYQDVTNQIIAALESGDVPPWKKPWVSSDPGLPLRHNGIPYKGANVILLWLVSMQRGFASPFFFTYKQAQDMGAHVKRGEKGFPIIYCQPLERKETVEDGQEVESKIWLTRGYIVFSAEQIEGLPGHFYAKFENQLDPAQRLQQADIFLSNTKADFRTGGGSAYYSPSQDYIQMPPFETFRTPESYAATCLHEAAHWTGHASRLNRLPDVGDKKAYAFEEIIADMASAFLGASLGIAPEVREDHAAYISHWVKLLKDDNLAVFKAAAAAQRACDYLHSLQPQL